MKQKLDTIAKKLQTSDEAMEELHDEGSLDGFTQEFLGQFFYCPNAASRLRLQTKIAAELISVRRACYP